MSFPVFFFKKIRFIEGLQLARRMATFSIVEPFFSDLFFTSSFGSPFFIRNVLFDNVLFARLHRFTTAPLVVVEFVLTGAKI